MKYLIIIFIGVFSLQTSAQDARIFENTWYLHDLVINEESNVPPINNEIPYVAADFLNNGELYTGMCEEGGLGILEYLSTSAFIVTEINFFAGGCQENYPSNQQYSSKYTNFWGSLAGTGNISYEIIDEGENSTLTITDTNGDYAIYENEMLLSVDDTTKPKFSIYPTLVKTSFNIKYDPFSKIQKIKIYNSYGQIVADIEKIESDIDISYLSTGIYLVTIHFNDFNIETKKIIKL